MIQEITAQGRNLEEMNIKAEMHTQHALASVRRGNRGRNGVKLHQCFVKSIWLRSTDLNIWPHWSRFLTLSWGQSSYRRQVAIFQHVEIPARCKSGHIWCREGKGLTKVMRQKGSIHTLDEAHCAHWSSPTPCCWLAPLRKLPYGWKKTFSMLASASLRLL